MVILYHHAGVLLRALQGVVLNISDFKVSIYMYCNISKIYCNGNFGIKSFILQKLQILVLHHTTLGRSLVWSLLKLVTLF